MQTETDKKKWEGFKIVISGQIVKIKKYELIPRKAEKKDLILSEEKQDPNQWRKDEYKNTAHYKAQQKISNYCTSNFSKNDLFITLTFDEGLDENDEDKKMEYALKEFDKFIKRLTRNSVKNEILLKWISVTERGKLHNRLHFHMICNYDMEFISGKSRFEKERNFRDKLWKNGNVKIKNIKSKKNKYGSTGVDDVGSYLCKYIGKDLINEKGKKKYYHSTNLVEPIIFNSWDCKSIEDFTELEDFIKDIQSRFIPCKDQAISYNDYWGNMQTSTYNQFRENTKRI